MSRSPLPLGMHFSVPDSDWTHEVRASAYLRLQPSVTNVVSALGTRVSLFKDAGARLKTEASVVILLPGMQEMPSISSQDESGLGENIFFSPNSSCLLLLLNHRLFFFFDTWSCYVAQIGLWMFKQKWPQPPKSSELGPQMSVNTSGLGHSLSRSQAYTSEALVNVFGLNRCLSGMIILSGPYHVLNRWYRFQAELDSFLFDDQVLPAPVTCLLPMTSEGRQREDASGVVSVVNNNPLICSLSAWCWL